MDASLKELSKLEKLQVYSLNADSSDNTKSSSSISDTLESLLDALQRLKQRVQTECSPEVLAESYSLIESKKKEIDEKQKEIHTSLGRLGKTIDKKFTGPLPILPELFSSDSSSLALKKTIAQHFIRTGQFEVVEVFKQETGVDVPSQLREQLREMHRILNALEQKDIGPALEWVNCNQDRLSSRSSPLEFHLHRSHYLHLLSSSTYPPLAAITYIQSISSTLYAAHAEEIRKLITCVLYFPLSKLALSPYSEYANPNIHIEVGLEFAQEYCASLGLSKQLPLRVVGDIGGGGALGRIEKGRKLMRERKSEWSQTNELPIEIPLPPENRYHSIFTCPVSKEQASDSNPPMMMGCGHVVNKDSLDKLKKSVGRVKCPYCPIESHASSSLRVYF